MKCTFGKIAALAIISLSSALLAAREMPMEFFKDFRKQIEDNNSSAAMKFQGKLKDDILTKGLSREMRELILSIEAAYEDVHVRQNDPDKAMIYAFYKVGKNQVGLQIELTVDSFGANWVFAAYPFPKKLPLPRECAERFIKFCAKGDISGIDEFLAPDLDKQFTALPLGLTANVESSFSGGTNYNSPNKVSVTRFGGISGTLTLEKIGYFWKITAIDPILLRPFPEQLLPTIAAQCKVYNAVYPVKAEVPEKKTEKTEESQDTAESAPQPAEKAEELPKPDYKELAEYLDPAFEISTENVIRTASFKKIKKVYSQGRKNITIDMEIDTTEEAGEISLSFTHDGNNWVIKAIKDSFVYRKNQSPEKISEQFLSSWYAANREAALVFMTADQQESVKEANLEEYKMENAAITVSNVEFSSPGICKADFEITFEENKLNGSLDLKLNNGEWKVSGKNLPKKAVKKENSGESADI